MHIPKQLPAAPPQTMNSRIRMMRVRQPARKDVPTETSACPRLSWCRAIDYNRTMQNSSPSGNRLDTLTLISLAGTATVLLAAVLLFTVPVFSDLVSTGYDTMYSAMNYMAEMCRF
jgi:hypothetical protein